MAADDRVEDVYRFFFAWFAFTLAVFPLVATVEALAFGGSLGPLVVLVVSVVVAVPAALEFLFSDRDPTLVGRFVVVFVALYFLALVGQSVVYVGLGLSETVPTAEVAVLVVTYVATYGLVYRGGLTRIKRAMTG